MPGLQEGLRAVCGRGEAVHAMEATSVRRKPFDLADERVGDVDVAERAFPVGSTPAFLVNDRLFMDVLDSLDFDLTYRELLR